MKVTLRYEEAEDKDLHLTLRLTLPKKYQTGETKDVVKMFVDHYNKKFSANPLDAEKLHLKVAGGNHLQPTAVMEDFVASGDDCYVLGGEITAGDAAPPKKTAASPAPAAAPAGKPGRADGKVRCKRFGCQRFYDPDGAPQECVHHTGPPIFHETAKWWSCCPDRKAYDFEEFMKITGCAKGVCSANPEGQESGKRFLGGTDLRAENAPKRLDADAPKEPRHKLADLRQGLESVGVDSALFDQVWGQMAAKNNGDLAAGC